MNARALALLTAVACLGRAAPSVALGSASPLSDYQITSYTGADGSTFGEVRSIAQDRDGYLWLATDGGLVRFDGFRFAAADLVAGTTLLPVAAARAVYVARDGSLWVGYAAGRGVYRIAEGEVRNVHLRGEIAGHINVITEDRSGSVWVGHDEGLHRLRDGRWDRVSLPGADPRLRLEGGPEIARRVLAVREDRAGTLWVAGAGGLYRRPAEGAFEKAPYGDRIARGLSEDSTGRMWTTDETAGFRRADAPERNHLFEARGMRVFHDSRGNLWVTTRGQGLWQVSNVKGLEASRVVRRATAQTGLVNDETSVMLEDREGNLWVASIQGLSRLMPRKALSLVDLGIVRALALGADGTAWVGTTTGLMALTGVSPRSPGKSRVVSTAPIRALHTAADGTVWAATDEGLQRVAGGRLVQVLPSGLRLGRIASMASARDVLWVCDEQHGLMRLAEERLERVPAVSDGMAAPPVLIHVDDRDRLWVAFSGGIVRRLDRDGRLEQYGPAEGLPHTTVNAIHHDRWGDIWIGGNRGLSRLRGNRFQTLSFRSEVRERSFAAVMDDGAGDLWIAFAFYGFIRVGRDEVTRAMNDSSYALTYRVYNTGYGAGYPLSSYGGSTARGREDSLWFLMSRGATVFDPRELRAQDRVPGFPRIEGATADDQRYAAATGAELPPRTSRLRIDYTAVNLSSPERIRFRYRLDGFDATWVDGTRQRQAFYTNLPPGAYRFRAQASMNAVTWDDAVADWSFSIQPTFYQTRWFYAVCLAGLALCGMGAWQLRVRHVRKELSIVFGERLRLSREIHDTLLQSLFGIALQVDLATRHVADPSSPLRVHLVWMRRQIEEYISEARQSILGLRSPTLDRRGLAGALQETGDRLTAGKVPFVFNVTGTPRRCLSKLETHVLRIGHEAVMNAVRHAEARVVEMEVTFDDRLLRLRVADDGRGFDAEQEPASGGLTHYGLMSMKERAADVGGRCTITSMPGAGVQIIAEFPLAPTA